MRRQTMTGAFTARALERLDAHGSWTWAQELFDRRDYYGAARVLQHLVDTHPVEAELGAARELLVRSYYHSAQTGRAVEAARELLQRDPANGYAALLLTRSLERASRRDEAAAARRVSDALGMAS
ncbi:hypothetical protein [Nocardioides coralli]|uniref:hypothetical protein n=1 Tax=Nocardioides coralli TaxID=2872154 RepID=UPI001CA45140|nr:hypothetical protein [Nocardioides coralli]QZY29087.1 hypothetical protein K6T13_16925 [Nocardioides coralli]